VIPANSKSLEDAFLNDAYKKSISDGIRQCNKKKKLSKASFNQDQESDTRLTVDNCIPGIFIFENPITKISAGLYQNNHRKKDLENIVQLIAIGIKNDTYAPICGISKIRDILQI